MPPRKKILIIGPYPPAYGGISVHIKRLKDLLQDFFDINIIDESRIRKDGILNIRSLKLWAYSRLIRRADIVHIHSPVFYVRFLNFMMAFFFRKKIIISIHSYRNKKNGIKFQIDRFIFKHSNKVVFVGKGTALRFHLENSYVNGAFIPTTLSEEDLLPKEILDWLIKRRSESSVICCANASRLKKYNNEDLYGLDLCIEAIKCLKSENVNVSFIFIVCDNYGEIKVEKYKKLIQKYNLSDYFFIYEPDVSFLRLISMCDIVIRPTNTDADAVDSPLTIMEGLSLKKIVIASDVVDRPQGTVLFENRNTVSLAATIKESVDNLNNKRENIAQPFDNHISRYIRFYRDVLYS